MDMKKFVESLTLNENNELYGILGDIRRKLAIDFAVKYPANHVPGVNIALHNADKLHAIKAYRDYYGSSLMEAKTAVEMLIETKNENL